MWYPPPELTDHSEMRQFMEWLSIERGVTFEDYHRFWLWSVNDLEGFWGALLEYFHLTTEGQFSSVVDKRVMPGAKWFEGLKLNYAEQLFSKNSARVISVDEEGLRSDTGIEPLRSAALHFAGYLKSVGVKKGDTVAAYATNTWETLAAFLGCALSGVIWSSASPDFGVSSVVERFQQIQPKVLVGTDGYQYAGKRLDKTPALKGIQSSVPSIKDVVLVQKLGIRPDFEHMSFEEALDIGSGTSVSAVRVPFEHPLWILYTSGTTGPPKPIVHSHGGILLEHMKALSLHHDLKPKSTFFWYTSTGWMMWNLLIGGLLVGSSIVLYDGNAFYPDAERLWSLAEDTGITHFGVSAPFIHQSMKLGARPGETHDVSRILSIGSTGSPLTREGFRWVYEKVKDDVWLASVSGGTDVCTAFVGACPLLPVYEGEIQCRLLGARVESYDDAGNSVTGQVGELVITEPMPSMPVYLWGDTDFRKYKEAYFDLYPGIWRHGDWILITERGTCIIYGRSDSTIKRHGVRLGTSEIYRVVEGLEEVVEALAVDTGGQDSKLILFVVPRGNVPDDILRQRIASRIREDLSPRFIPDLIVRVSEIPKTLNGKKLEVPVKRLLQGIPPDKAVNIGSVANPNSLRDFVEFAKKMI